MKDTYAFIQVTRTVAAVPATYVHAYKEEEEDEEHATRVHAYEDEEDEDKEDEEEQECIRAKKLHICVH